MTTATYGELATYLDLLKLMVREPAVVGAELPFFRVIRRELEEGGRSVTLYEGLMVCEGADPDAGYLSVHVDRHGLVATGPEEFQYAAFAARNRADLTGNSVSEQTYRTLSDRFVDQAVQAYDPWAGSYLGRGVIRKAWVCERRGNLVFEVDALGPLTPGTPVAFLDRLRVTDHHVMAQLDNVLTVAMATHLAVRGFPGTVFFTAAEEAGRSWRYLLEWFRRADRTTDRLLVLDTSPYPDRAAADAQEVVLRRRDANATFAAGTVEWVEGTARELGIRTAYKDAFIDEINRTRAAESKPPRSLGSTELGRLIAADGRISGATIQVPTTGYHTTGETASLASVVDTLRLLDGLLMTGVR